MLRHTVTAPSHPLPGRRPLDRRRTMLLVVDLQNTFLLPGQPFHIPFALGVVDNVNRLAAAARAAGIAVVWLRHTLGTAAPYALPAWQKALFPDFAARLEAGCVQGTPGHAIHEDLGVAPGDMIVDKYRFSAFLPNSSDLDRRLKLAGVDSLIITGAATDACCASTARDALQLDYEVLFVSDATATMTDAAHNATLTSLANDMPFFDVRPTEEVIPLMAVAGEG